MKLYEYIMDKVSWCITLAPFMCLVLIYSCQTVKYVPVETKADSVVIEKLVEVQIPPDSATIRALLECDENGKVVLKWLDIANSKNAQAQLTIDSLGNLLAKMKTQPDTVYLPAKEVVVSKKEKSIPLFSTKVSDLESISNTERQKKSSDSPHSICRTPPYLLPRME